MVRTHEIGQSAGKGAKLVMTEQAPPSETARFSSANDGCQPEALCDTVHPLVKAWGPGAHRISRDKICLKKEE